MAMTNAQEVIEPVETSVSELYRLLGEGYSAMKEGRICTIEEVREELYKRKVERG